MTARSDLECLRLGKGGFESVLRARPEIATEISRVIASRQGRLDEVSREAGAQTGEDDPSAAIGARIRAFFGLSD